MKTVKSLRLNIEDGVDIPNHRTHRSKKGQNNWNLSSTPRFFEYKRRKNELKYENDDETLAF